MASREIEERFEKHCNELRAIIEQDIESLLNLMRDNKSFKKEYKNAKEQLDLLETLIKVRKKSYTVALVALRG